MAYAIEPLKALQFGRESTAGTIVAATRRMSSGQYTVQEIVRKYRDNDENRGYVATTGGAGVAIQKETKISYTAPLSPQEITWALLTGIRGNPTVTAAAPMYTWPFSRSSLTISNPTLDTISAEWLESDGTTNHVAREAGYGFCTKFGIKWARNEIAMFNADFTLRAAQTSTPTTSLTPYANLARLPSNLVSVYLDSAYGSIGGTQLTGIIISGEYECETGVEPVYDTQGRSDLDYGGVKVSGLAHRLKLLMELNATSASRIGEWRSNSTVAIRVKATGDVIGGGVYTVQVDGNYRYLNEEGPVFGNVGRNRTVALDLEGVVDSSGNWGAFSVIDDLAAVANL